MAKKDKHQDQQSGSPVSQFAHEERAATTEGSIGPEVSEFARNQHQEDDGQEAGDQFSFGELRNLVRDVDLSDTETISEIISEIEDIDLSDFHIPPGQLKKFDFEFDDSGDAVLTFRDDVIFEANITEEAIIIGEGTVGKVVIPPLPGEDFSNLVSVLHQLDLLV